jgi:predicted phage terminase large subunit-like protein
MRTGRLEQMERAKTSMIDFMQLMRPDPDHPNDPKYSAFEVTPLAKLLCQIIEKVDKGELKRVCVSVGPQLGKSEVLSRGAPAWLFGRRPRRKMMLGAYNGDFAAEFGADVRDIVTNPVFKSIFPSFELKTGSEAKDNLGTTRHGKMAFVGVGGSGTGKSADVFFIDDPIKNDEEAQSETYRERVWKWFNSVAMTRCHKNSAIIVVHTRWHEDDLIGRLCDPSHPERNKKYKGIADRWTYINLPAVVTDPELAKALGLTLEKQTDPFIKEQFGTVPMVSLWEERKSLEFLAEAKLSDDRVFGALYMGEPTPGEGIYFTEETLLEYGPSDLPKNLRWYGASDHAVSKKQQADSTVLGCFGVDENDHIWIAPDVTWAKMETDETVEEMIRHMKTHKPQVWWMESELISKSFGPFLKREMIANRVFSTSLKPVTPSKDKSTRARAIQGRMGLGMVHFPRHAPWWSDAKNQLLKFPYGTHDDFVDFCSWIGIGLMSEIGAARVTEKEAEPKVGTIGWIKKSSVAQARELRLVKNAKGW